MKTIGLIGGLSWESSQLYYQIINETVRERLGGLHSADCLMYSFDFHEIEVLQANGDWDAATARMVEAGQRLGRGGAEVVIICSNTMHRMAVEVADAIDVPLLHIADPTAHAAMDAGIKKIGLLGTAYTMEQEFYAGCLRENHGLDVLIPDDGGRELVHRVIYDELVKGVINEESRAAYIDVIDVLVEQGAEGIILGCTEIGMLIQQQHCSVPTFDTTELHAVAAVEFALEGVSA